MTYTPDIIIGGSTLHLFFDDLDIRNSMKNFGSIDYTVKDCQLFIDAYNPAQTKINRDIFSTLLRNGHQA